jgi:hypothetical protein
VTARIDGLTAARARHEHSRAAGTGGFARAFEQALRRLDRPDAPATGTATAELDARAALELQAAVYRRAEEIELASRLLDHGVSAVKTILQTRI